MRSVLLFDSAATGRPVVAWGLRQLGLARSAARVSADSGGAILTTTTTSTAIVPFDLVFADPKRLALGGFRFPRLSANPTRRVVIDRAFVPRMQVLANLDGEVPIHLVRPAVDNLSRDLKAER